MPTFSSYSETPFCSWQVAQSLADRLAAAGIRAILNFTPVNLRVPPGVKLNAVDLTVEMENLAFFLSNPESR